MEPPPPINLAELEVNTLGDAFDAISDIEMRQWSFSSGLLGVRQYGSYGQMFDPARGVTDVAFGTANIHNHPNSAVTLGMAELALLMNGHYFRTRHQDYRNRRNGPM